MYSLRRKDLEDKVFSIQHQADFDAMSCEVFHFQYESNPIYREYCDLLGVKSVKTPQQIPFLPIAFFKTHSHKFGYENSPNVFMSSGTTLQTRSQHYVPFIDLYERSFLSTYTSQIGNPAQQLIVALLPNYIEQGNSSLVFMVASLIQLSQNSKSGFYLHQEDELLAALYEGIREGKHVVLFGVSYALIDLAEMLPNLNGTTIIETGGMKGRRKELTKSELHQLIKTGLNVEKVYSEYGMTELLSQAYSLGDQWFESPPWFQIRIRETNDPRSMLEDGLSGAINCIDLANLYSCSFIATDDLGVKQGNRFQVLGRMDNSDIRGCNLLVNS